MRSSTLYLRDIADAMERIEEFTAGMTYDGFLHDDRTQEVLSSESSRSSVRRRNSSRRIFARGTPRYPGVQWSA